MLKVVEVYSRITEDLDVQKAGHKETYKLLIVGSKPELDFMENRFIRANFGNKYWFNTKYNPNPPKDASGKSFYIFPPERDRETGKYFFWRTKTPEFVEAQLRAIQMFLQDVNRELAKSNRPDNPEAAEHTNPKLDAFLTKIEQVRDYIEQQVLPELTEVPDTKEKIQANLEKFIDELANAVSDADLVEKVQAYLSFASVFHYSFFNTFLIYLQNPKAREVLAIGDWAKLNMQPKSPEHLGSKYGAAGAIGLWVPHTVKGSTDAIVRAENQWREKYGFAKVPTDTKINDLWYNKKGDKRKLPAYQQVSLDKYVRIASSKMQGYMQMKVKFRFLDIEDVEQMANMPVVSKPTAPEWHTSEPDEIADKVYEAAVAVIRKLGINLREKEEMGGAKGSSSWVGDINLLSSNVGVGRASTAIHELGHALTHQDFLQKSHGIQEKVKKIEAQERAGVPEKDRERLTHEEQIIKDAYWGRGDDPFAFLFGDNGVLELQAEGIAFVVLRYYGIDIKKLKHSAAYIALWRGDKDKVRANLEIISNTAKGIISLMNEQMSITSNYDKAKETSAQTGEIGESEELEEENLSFLYEMDIIRLHSIINEIKGLRSELVD